MQSRSEILLIAILRLTDSLDYAWASKIEEAIHLILPSIRIQEYLPESSYNFRLNKPNLGLGLGLGKKLGFSTYLLVQPMTPR